jgi:uncharacterized membrane protein YfcA
VASISPSRSVLAGLTGGGLVGALGGLLGLGGAEFRLPMLISVFRFPPLEAVILNKALSLVVVTFALSFRSISISFESLATHGPAAINVLIGSLPGAWLGAAWATRLRSEMLCRVIAVLLVVMAIALLFAHSGSPLVGDPPEGLLRLVVGVMAGLAIGLVAALMGVAGGELLIPTFILLFGIDIKVAGSLSLAVSLPTMLVGFARYARDASFAVLKSARMFAMAMALGSVLGAAAGALLLSHVDGAWLYPLLAAILLISSIKIWRHRFGSGAAPQS